MQSDQVLHSVEDSHTPRGVAIIALPPGQNSLFGLVENGLSLDWNADRVRFWPTGCFYFPGGGSVELDGSKDAEHLVAHYRARLDDWQIDMVETSDEHVPIRIDWRSWKFATDKFGRRNPPFIMRE